MKHTTRTDKPTTTTLTAGSPILRAAPAGFENDVAWVLSKMIDAVDTAPDIDGLIADAVDQITRLAGFNGPRWSEMIRVKCSDGHIRHEPFETRREAANWAEWGHCCLGTHTFERLLQGPERSSA